MTYRQTMPALAAAGLLVVASSPAFATLTATGSIDPSATLQTYVGLFLSLAGLLFIAIFGWKGIMVALDGRHAGPSIIGLLLGVVICFGGYYILSKAGVT